MMINVPLICGLAGWIIAVFSGAFALPLTVSLFFGDGCARPFVLSIIISLSIGSLFIFLGGQEAKMEPRYRDGLAVVGLSWFAINVLGAMPYWFTGKLGFWDGIFESFSGLSSTGSSVIPDLRVIPEGLLFWRAQTQWIGGMGIIVLMVAILPFLGVGGQIMLKSESSGPTSEKLRPRVAQTAKSLWMLYLALSLLLCFLLMVGGLPPFEAICQTMTVISTGGFANYNESAGFHQSYFVKWVLIVFMFIGSLSFAMVYQVLSGQLKSLLNPEAIFFLLIITAASILVATPLVVNGYFKPGEALFHSIFQVVSVISTTGLSTTDWGAWPELSQAVLLALFFIGGCSGSTSGGLKCVRWLILFKSLYRSMRQAIHPRGVFPVRLGGKPISDQVLEKVWLYILLYIVSLVIGTLLLLIMGIELNTSFTAVASSMGNVGPVLGQIGPTSDLSSLPGAAKGVLSVCMLLGRLEFYSLLLLLFPEFWSR
ncbi:MAG: TrkH family potassium uptake protein [Deltaproteobacteria bacterium]|jgi:trk system potassium uptake protein TrkH|nr:TrkH family potassium uptake protein [Deltaproteobacteria bacterium]